MDGLTSYLNTPVEKRTAEGLHKAMDIFNALKNYLYADARRMSGSNSQEMEDLEPGLGGLFDQEKVGQGENPIWDTN